MKNLLTTPHPTQNDYINAIVKLGSRVYEAAQVTPLQKMNKLSERLHNAIWIKREDRQPVNSFKLRGAYAMISTLSDEQKQAGVIAASAGNHAQGVAYAARELGIKAVIVMPKTTPLIKVQSTKKYGAEVVLYGDVYDDAYQKAKELEAQEGYVFVHPFDDIDVLEGQGTIALEILEEMPDAEVIVVPIGGGGLISGIAAAAKMIKPDIKIIGVEPSGAASATEALIKNKVVTLPEANTIADGTAVKRIGDLTFNCIKQYVDEVVTVDDYELTEAFLLLAEKHKIIAENSGILPLAALKKLTERGKKVVPVVSGGNIDVLMISSMIGKGLISRDRIFNFAVSIPDRPGELAKITHIIADVGANIVKLAHNQFKNLSRFRDKEVLITVETNGTDHIQALVEAFAAKGYEVTAK